MVNKHVLVAALIFRVSAAEAAEQTIDLEPVVILGTRIESAPKGRTHGGVDRGRIESTDAFSLRDLLINTPGVFSKQSNGPRDMSISVRGSGAKTGFAIRNIKTYEDWFPMTQSDGLSRTDAHDPNAYDGIDVIRGPSSSLYDNYALGGVVNFRTRRGRDVDGWDAGLTGGSYGYHNKFVHVGRAVKGFEYSAFGSHIRGDGYIRASGFTTMTQNLVMRFTPDADRTITFKFLNNDVNTEVPSRLSRVEMDADRRSAGTTLVTGVGTVTAQRAAQKRADRRTMAGARYERKLGDGLGFRFLGAYDVKDIHQVFGTIGDTVNTQFQQSADLTKEHEAFGGQWRHFAGIFFNQMEQKANSWRNLADGLGTNGVLQADVNGYHRNMGARLREEAEFGKWTLIAGLGAEHTKIKANARTRVAAEVYLPVDVDRSFFNVAPELAAAYDGGALFKPRARVATAYGTPAISNLTTTANGLPGNNGALESQKNIGFEAGLGGDSADQLFRYDAAVYWELFQDEMVTQSPGGGLASFTANAPRSEHRGLELFFEARPKGFLVSGAYTLNDHVYRDFSETIGPGVTLDRKGKSIPGVERHVLQGRLGYEKPRLPGGWLEAVHVPGYAVNNSNTLFARGYTQFNANLHWTREVAWGWVKRAGLTFDVRNLANTAYDGSAVVVADASTDTPAAVQAKQAFFTGAARSIFAGLRLHF
jgi:iron complex outermembrane receptor protein